ncbi:MAG: hypothetical protein FWH32_00335 [Clostridiales bacterium]|nr:hypothetical protein [Clostridiales bacterium]
MSNVDEQRFKEALQTLVRDEPERLAFFDGLDSDAKLPPFVPNNTVGATPATGRPPLPTSARTKRVRYTFGIAAAAACLVMVLSINALDSGSNLDMLNTSVSEMSGSGGAAPEEAYNEVTPASAPEAAYDDVAPAPTAARTIPQPESEIEELDTADMDEANALTDDIDTPEEANAPTPATDDAGMDEAATPEAAATDPPTHPPVVPLVIIAAVAALLLILFIKRKKQK